SMVARGLNPMKQPRERGNDEEGNKVMAMDFQLGIAL
ncbi:unnamed protein product, partial [marine sediment metagenome]